MHMVIRTQNNIKRQGYYDGTAAPCITRVFGYPNRYAETDDNYRQGKKTNNNKPGYRVVSESSKKLF